MKVQSLCILSINSLKNKKLILKSSVLSKDIKEQIAVQIIQRWWREKIEYITSQLHLFKLNSDKCGYLDSRPCGHSYDVYLGLYAYTEYLFGILHGKSEDYYGFECINTHMYKFGKLNGRSTGIAFGMENVVDFKYNLKHGLEAKWNESYYINDNEWGTSCGHVNLYIDDEIVEMRDVNDRYEYNKLLKDTENMKPDEWYKFTLLM